MSRTRYYTYLFRAAAIWSWLISIAVLLGNATDETLFRSLLPQVEPHFILDVAVIPIFLFGFAFWWLSLDLDRNPAVAAVGAAGGVLVFLSAVFRVATGDISIAILPAAAVDLSLNSDSHLKRYRRSVFW